MKLNPQKMLIMQELDETERRNKVESYKRLNKTVQKGKILFTGSSLMEQFPITEMAQSSNLGKVIYNRGIGGFKTVDFLEHMDVMLLELEPKYVFINIGTNDLSNTMSDESWQQVLERNYDAILAKIKRELPETIVYVMAYYPMDESNEDAIFFREYFGDTRSNASIAEASAIASKLAKKYAYNYIDVNDGLTDENGNLKKEFCKDAIHFYPDGYEVVFNNIKKYLEECNE